MNIDEPARLSLKKLRRLHELLGLVVSILDGKSLAFVWGDGKRRAWFPLLRAAGVELVTERMAAKAGDVIKYGANPVGQVYFGAPLKRTCDVWILHVQTRPKTPADLRATEQGAAEAST